MFNSSFLKKIFSFVIVSSLLTCGVPVKPISFTNPQSNNIIVNVALFTICLAAATVPTYFAAQNMSFLSNLGGYSPSRCTRESFMLFRRNASDAWGLLSQASKFISNRA